MAFKIRHHRHVWRLTNPVTWGSMSAMQTVDATAASTAFPPRLRTSSPISEQEEWPLTTLSVSWASGVPSIIKTLKNFTFYSLSSIDFQLIQDQYRVTTRDLVSVLGLGWAFYGTFCFITKYDFSFKSCLSLGFQYYIKLSKTTTVSNYCSKFHFKT